MVDRDLNFKIRQLRARGKTYDEIAFALHVGRSTIARVLKAESRTGRDGTVVSASLSDGESHYISESIPIGDGNHPGTSESNAVGSPGDAFIDRESIDPVLSGPGFLESLSDSLTPRSDLSIKKRSPFSPWGKILFVLISAVLLILFLNKVREEALEDE